MSLNPFATHWYYNTESGQLTQGNNLENLGNNLVGGLGWHELNIPGNATVQQAAAEAEREFPNGHAPTNAGLGPQRVAQAAANTAKSAASTAFKDTIGNGFNLIFGNTTGLLTRILKVVFGGVLIIAGVLRMTNAEKHALEAVGTVAKGAVL
jgi:hypothetical protein